MEKVLRNLLDRARYVANRRELVGNQRQRLIEGIREAELLLIQLGNIEHDGGQTKDRIVHLLVLFGEGGLFEWNGASATELQVTEPPDKSDVGTGDAAFAGLVASFASQSSSVLSSENVLSWARSQVTEEEIIDGIREIRETGGLELKEFIHKLEQAARANG